MLIVCVSASAEL